MHIAVTGNIGCGKSTVCQRLLGILPGYVGFSVDEAVRGLYADAEFVAQVQARFGCSTRRELSDLVFADAALRRELEALSARYVTRLLEEALQSPRVVVEFPLLFEMAHWVPRFDFILALGCDEATQRQRVFARDGLSDSKFEQVRGAQLSTAVKLALAHAQVDTSGTLADVEVALEALLPQLNQAALRVRALRFFGTSSAWERIAAAYGEPHRAYHTVQHLMELFHVLDPWLEGHPHARAIELAVWFHDYVYSTASQTYAQNEARSAEALMRWVSEFRPDWLTSDSATVLLACEFILATRGHAVGSPYLKARPDARAACELFLDADLAILSATPERFTEYDQQIAREWGQCPDAPEVAFAQGRATAMAAFAQRETLYYTAAFAPRSVLARGNLAALIAQWRAKAAA